MADSRRAEPPDKIEVVSDLLIKQVAAKLLANEVYNDEHGYKRGDPRRRIATHGELETKTGVDANLLRGMFGAVRSGERTKKIARSKYVGRIRRALGIQSMVTIEIREDRAALASSIGSLTDEQFERFEKRLKVLMTESSTDPT